MNTTSTVPAAEHDQRPVASAREVERPDEDDEDEERLRKLLEASTPQHEGDDEPMPNLAAAAGAAAAAALMAELAGTPSRTNSELFRLLLVTAHRLAVEMGQLGAETLPVMGVLVLQEIASSFQAPTPGELASTFGSSRSAMTRLLDRLERDRIVTRRPDPHASRAKLVALTEKGRAHLERAQPRFDRWMMGCTRGIGEREKKDAITFLERLASQAQVASVTRADPPNVPRERRRNFVHIR